MLKLYCILKKARNFSHFFDQKKFKIVSQGDKIPNHDYHNHMISLLKFFIKKI